MSAASLKDLATAASLVTIAVVVTATAIVMLFVLWTEYAYSRGAIAGETRCYEESTVDTGT